MEEKDLQNITEKLTNSLENTQMNSIDIEKLVSQVRFLSESDTYRQIITAIIDDDSIDWNQKIVMIQEITENYDQREGRNTQRVIDLQNAQTQNVGEATSWWAAHWWLLLVGGVAVLGARTPAGKKIISSIFSSGSQVALPA